MDQLCVARGASQRLPVGDVSAHSPVAPRSRTIQARTAVARGTHSQPVIRLLGQIRLAQSSRTRDRTRAPYRPSLSAHTVGVGGSPPRVSYLEGEPPPTQAGGQDRLAPYQPHTLPTTPTRTRLSAMTRTGSHAAACTSATQTRWRSGAQGHMDSRSGSRRHVCRPEPTLMVDACCPPRSPGDRRHRALGSTGQSPAGPPRRPSDPAHPLRRTRGPLAARTHRR